MAAVISRNECFIEKLIKDVQSTFIRLETALKSREIQILRQIDVILQQYKLNDSQKFFNKINVVFDNEIDILKSIANFGVIDFEGVTHDLYSTEEYETPHNEHVCKYKCLQNCVNISEISSESFTNDDPTMVVDEKINLKMKSPSSSLTYKKNTISPYLKPKNSYEDLNKSSDSSVLESSLSSNNITTSNMSENSSFEFHECKSIENSVSSEDKDKSKSFRVSSRASFEFYETSLDNSVENETNVETSPTIKKILSQPIKHSFNRHDIRYAKISESHSDKLVNNSKIEDIANCNNIDEVQENGHIVNIEAVNEKNTTDSEIQIGPVRKISLEHPIQVQQWMQQIIREPETEPIHNNELLEHVNISTSL